MNRRYTRESLAEDAAEVYIQLTPGSAIRRRSRIYRPVDAASRADATGGLDSSGADDWLRAFRGNYGL